MWRFGDPAADVIVEDLEGNIGRRHVVGQPPACPNSEGHHTILLWFLHFEITKYVLGYFSVKLRIVVIQAIVLEQCI